MDEIGFDTCWAKLNAREAKVDKMGFVVDYKSPVELNKLKKDEYEIANALAKKMGLRSKEGK